MSEKETGGHAFQLGASEYAGHGPQAGMTLRDYFAANAIPALICDFQAKVSLSKSANSHNISFAQEVAYQAYSLADAMLAERAK